MSNDSPRIDSPANKGGSDGAEIPNFEPQSLTTHFRTRLSRRSGDKLHSRASDSMSGVEIIGLMLGVLPLVISAAEDYKKCFEPLERWRRFKFVFRDFITSVDIQRQMFQLVLKKLLIRVKLPAEEKQRLLTVPNYEGWSEPETVDAIRSRLGESYDACMEILGAMKENMQELQVMMSLKDGSVCCPCPWLFLTHHAL
jgi:hypothetical protein